MTVVQPNSIAGINSITVQSGNSLAIHKSDGTLIREIVSSTGISTYSSISVGSAATDNNAGKSINIGLGASISQHADNSLSLGTNGDERFQIDSSGNVYIGGVGASATAGSLWFNDTSANASKIAQSNGNSALTFHTGSSQPERTRIDSSGRILVGVTATRSAGTTTAHLVQVEALDASSGFTATRCSANSGGPYLTLTKTRAASLGDDTVVQVNDSLGMIRFAGADGTDTMNVAASINASVDGTPGTDDMPGRLVFSTTADGANTATERLRITAAGNVDINGTPPWSVAGGDYRNLSISGQTASSSGFIWLGNGTAATNADFDLARLNICNGATIVAQITGTTQTSANDDGRLSFYTKATGGTIAERLRIDSSGAVNVKTGNVTLDDGRLFVKKAAIPSVDVRNSTNTSYARLILQQGDAEGGYSALQRLGTNSSAIGGANATQLWCTGNAPIVVATNNAERLYIDGSGYSIIKGDSTGGSAKMGGFGSHNWDPKFQVLHDQGAVIVRDGDEVWGAGLHLGKCRGTYASPTAAVADDRAGGLYYHAHDGTDFANYVAGIEAFIDETPGSNDTPGRLIFSTAANGGNTLSERLRITHDGKCVVGGNSGAGYNTLLQVHGSGDTLLTLNSTSGGGKIKFYESGTGRFNLETLNGSGGLMFYDATAGADRARFLSDGTFVVKGTTNSSSTSAGYKIIDWGSNGTWHAHLFDSSVAGNTPGPYLRNLNGSYNGVRFYPRVDGGLANYQSNNANLCDERAKQDIVDLGDQWSILKQYRVRKFRYKQDPSSTPLKIGVIAQQIETISPELVVEDWPYEGDPNNPTTLYKTVKEEQMFMVAMKTLQEAQARIETLETEVAALKSS